MYTELTYLRNILKEHTDKYGEKPLTNLLLLTLIDASQDREEKEDEEMDIGNVPDIH